ncbi:hypothetical protein AAG747_00280 [Rapidithrix thailandica]|uniref:Uncharacterized protein n=1 Tax=Rapidithrix thailandica TaxID=413964 RepID=A0AAW9S3K4_9BACT
MSSKKGNSKFENSVMNEKYERHKLNMIRLSDYAEFVLKILFGFSFMTLGCIKKFIPTLLPEEFIINHEYLLMSVGSTLLLGKNIWGGLTKQIIKLKEKYKIVKIEKQNKDKLKEKY